MLYVKLGGLNSCKEMNIIDESEESNQSNDSLISLSNHSIISDDTNLNNCLIGFSGNILYTAPEILSNNPYDCKVDVYSFGILAFWLLTGKYPYDPICSVNRSNFIQGLINHYDLLKK